MSEEPDRIDAGDIVLGDLYKNYLFDIPNYQRPFSWEDEQFDELIDDLLGAYDRNIEEYGDVEDNLLDYEPYFLGSLILQRLAQKDRFDVVDGQQRLTSLAILMAVLRDELEGTQIANNLHEKLYEEGDAMINKPEQYRLSVRNQEEDFFEEYIVDRGGTKKVGELDKNTLSEPKQRFVEAVQIFRDRLQNWSNENSEDSGLYGFGQFLGSKITLVEIKTGSRNSAFRLFNVVNARGMPLSTADLLKSDNLSSIPDDMEDEYTERWVDIETDVGSDTLDTFINMIRHLKVKRKAQKSVYDEFDNIVFVEEPEFKGEPFVETLEDIYNIYNNRILRKNIDTENEAIRTRYKTLVSIVNSFYPSEDWMMGIIKFDQKFSNENAFYQFFESYERKIATDWLSGRSLSERLTQLYNVVELIQNAETIDEVLNDSLLTDDVLRRRDSFESTLDADNFYRKGNYRMAKYLLLRLDMERHDTRDVAIYRDSVTIEHILPQNPKSGYWTEQFDDEAFRMKWKHRLGNLLPLNGRKNSSASNRPFKEKVSTYFVKRSDFALVNDIQEDDDWTPEKLMERHRDLKQEALDCWF